MKIGNRWDILDSRLIGHRNCGSLRSTKGYFTSPSGFYLYKCKKKKKKITPTYYNEHKWAPRYLTTSNQRLLGSRPPVLEGTMKYRERTHAQDYPGIVSRRRRRRTRRTDFFSPSPPSGRTPRMRSCSDPEGPQEQRRSPWRVDRDRRLQAPRGQRPLIEHSSVLPPPQGLRSWEFETGPEFRIAQLFA